MAGDLAVKYHDYLEVFFDTDTDKKSTTVAERHNRTFIYQFVKY